MLPWFVLSLLLYSPHLTVAFVQKLAKRAASERPYKPTVHVLVLPSQLPLDLRLSVRCLDENFLVWFILSFIFALLTSMV